jgi:putative membrane protein
MVYLLLNWILGTAALALLALVFPGFRIDEVSSALIAAALVALVHAAISAAFRPSPDEPVHALPGLLLALGDTVVFRLVALLVPGFAMRGLIPALAGGLLLLGLNLLLPRLLHERDVVPQPLMNS